MQSFSKLRLQQCLFPTVCISRIVYGSRRHEALLYADMGSNEQSDLVTWDSPLAMSHSPVALLQVQVSRTVIIHLDHGDSLTMEQVEGRSPSQATIVKKISFCVLLLNTDSILTLEKPQIQLPPLPGYNSTYSGFKTLDATWIEGMEEIIKNPTVICSY